MDATQNDNQHLSQLQIPGLEREGSAEDRKTKEEIKKEKNREACRRYRKRHPERPKQDPAYFAKYYEKWREKYNRRQKKYFVHNREKILARNKAWRDKNKEHTKAHAKAFRIANIEKIKEKSRAYYLNNREKINAYNKAYRLRNKASYRARQIERRKELRMKIFQAYGGPFCKCCGKDDFALLAIDHINNNGAAHRREFSYMMTSANLLQWLRKNNFPPGFQVLCYECNLAKSIYGQCPHTKIRTPIDDYFQSLGSP